MLVPSLLRLPLQELVKTIGKLAEDGRVSAATPGTQLPSLFYCIQKLPCHTSLSSVIIKTYSRARRTEVLYPLAGCFRRPSQEPTPRLPRFCPPSCFLPCVDVVTFLRCRLPSGILEETPSRSSRSSRRCVPVMIWCYHFKKSWAIW
jgi:hypothetical protein